MLNLLYSGASSACLELVNDTPYRAPESFTVLLNDQEQYTCDTNVFSLFGLRPDTAYTVTLRGETLREATAAFETDILSQALAAQGGNIAAAARALGSTPRIVAYKIRKYDIKPITHKNTKE